MSGAKLVFQNLIADRYWQLVDKHDALRRLKARKALAAEEDYLLGVKLSAVCGDHERRDGFAPTLVG